MDHVRLERLLATLHASDFAVSSVLERICLVSRPTLGIDGATITRVSSGQSELVVASDEDTAMVELLQLTLGEGPSIEALRSYRRTRQGDLRSSEARERWPKFTGAALEKGIGAAFAFPLLTGGVAVGVFGMYRTEPGEMADDQIADATVLADLAALAVDQPGAVMTIDDLGIAVEPTAPWAHPAVVHNACGMIAEQQTISVDEALLRLRALAFVQGASVVELARAVVARDLRVESWPTHE